MWFDPPVLIVRKFDAVGAWLVCLIVAASCFGWPIVTATFSTSVIRCVAAVLIPEQGGSVGQR